MPLPVYEVTSVYAEVGRNSWYQL